MKFEKVLEKILNREFLNQTIYFKLPEWEPKEKLGIDDDGYLYIDNNPHRDYLTAGEMTRDDWEVWKPKRKLINFFNAMEALSEGKTISNEIIFPKGDRLKKESSSILYFYSGEAGVFVKAIEIDRGFDSWYIVKD